jgi:hypothetical protein
MDHQFPDQYKLQGIFMYNPMDEALKFISDQAILKFKEKLRTINTDGVFNRRKIFLQTR